MAITRGGIAFIFYDSENWDDFLAYYPVMVEMYPGWKATFFTEGWAALTGTQKTQMVASQADGMEIQNHQFDGTTPAVYLATHTEEEFYTNQVEANQNDMIAGGITPPKVLAYSGGEAPRTLSNLILSKITAIKLVMRKTCGIFNDTEYSKGYYKSFFAQGNGGMGWVDINADSSRSTHDLRYIIEQLEYCKDNNDVYIHTGHAINQTGSGALANSFATIQALSHYCYCNNMRFYTMSELADAGFVGTSRNFPSVSVILVTGTQSVGNNLTAAYIYQDDNDTAESGTTFQWYRADDVLGTNSAPIGGATALIYLLTGADSGKYVRIGITPRSVTPSTGYETFTKWFSIS